MFSKESGMKRVGEDIKTLTRMEGVEENLLVTGSAEL